MRVRIGQTWAKDPSEAEKLFANSLMSKVKRQAIYGSKPSLERLGNELQEVAEQEAYKMFDILADIIDESVDNDAGLTGAELGQGFSGVLDTSGEIGWAPLTDRYVRQKQQRFGRGNAAIGSNALRMFRWSGDLSRYFRRSGPSIINSRFGGVKLTVDTSGLAGENLRDAEATTDTQVYGEDGSLQKFLLGRINLSIFPDISPSLLPGLSSARWEATLQRPDFEEAMFGDLRTGVKLAQHHGNTYYYRPLVLPAVQFWIMVRLPAAIRDALSRHLSRTQIKDLGI